MSKAPPLLPTEVFRRVLRVSQIDGTGLLAFAGTFALLSAWLHDVTGTVAGLLIAGAGAMELHGTGLIRGGHERGMSWLIASQGYLMAAVFGYVGWQLTHIDISILRPVVTDEWRQALETYKVTEDQFLTLLYITVYGCFAAVTALYQGWMMIYYARRRPRVVAAIAEIFGND
jgi:hypothetical protein